MIVQYWKKNKCTDQIMISKQIYTILPELDKMKLYEKLFFTNNCSTISQPIDFQRLIIILHKITFNCILLQVISLDYFKDIIEIRLNGNTRDITMISLFACCLDWLSKTEGIIHFNHLIFQIVLWKNSVSLKTMTTRLQRSTCDYELHENLKFILFIFVVLILLFLWRWTFQFELQNNLIEFTMDMQLLN